MCKNVQQFFKKLPDNYSTTNNGKLYLNRIAKNLLLPSLYLCDIHLSLDYSVLTETESVSW